jgi:hypothetical protein
MIHSRHQQATLHAVAMEDVSRAGLGYCLGLAGFRDESRGECVIAHTKLIEISLNRYLINSSMLPSRKTDTDGGLTIYFR